MKEDLHKRKVMDAFKLHGLSLKLDARKYLCEILDKVGPSNVDELLVKFVEAVLKQPMETPQVTVDILVNAKGTISQRRGDNETDLAFNVIGAFDFPKVCFPVDQKPYLAAASTDGLANAFPGLFGQAIDKTKLFRERYSLIHQRLSRNPLFMPRVSIGSANMDENSVKLQCVEALHGMKGSKTELIVSFGMITQLKEDKFFLEDLTGVMELDLQSTDYLTPGLYTENCMVLVEGHVFDKTLFARRIGHPPPESIRMTRGLLGDLNAFGGPSSIAVKLVDKLHRIEKSEPSASICILSDVWLDSDRVIGKLEQLFDGFKRAPPIAFVMCGHFTTNHYGPDRLTQLAAGFRRLADILGREEFKSLVERSHFVFVPSAKDTMINDIFPCPPISMALVKSTEGGFRSIVDRLTPDRCHFATNPCRIQYCTKEIVIFREDLVHKMCRNTIHMPSGKQEITTDFAVTILSQSHLTPLPIHVSPVFWPRDYALQLYPMPDLLVVADKYDPYTYVHEDRTRGKDGSLPPSEDRDRCTVVNPGSFPQSNFAFSVYVPESNVVEDSIVPSG